MKQPKAFIIILNYNGKDTIKECLGSVFQTTYSNYETIVVDNSSQDGSLEMAKEFFPKAHFIRNEKNVGFSAGNNVGIRFALERMADYVFVLNNDAIIEPTTLEDLIDEAEKNKNAGILSPIIYGDNEKLWFAGGKIDWFKMKATHIDNRTNSNPFATEYVSGCAMLVKKEVFKKIGLFDEKFFLYYEDADFSVRAQRAGFDLLVVPEVEIVHLEESERSNKEKIYWLVISGIIFFKKNATFPMNIWIALYLIARRMKNKRDVKEKGDETSLQVQKAYNDYFKNN